jgi:hypothetical protein
MPTDEKRIKALSDVDLELEYLHLSPSYRRSGHPIVKELFSRRKQKEDNNKKTQTAIKYMTAVILALTAIGVILTIALLVKEKQDFNTIKTSSQPTSNLKNK